MTASTKTSGNLTDFITTDETLHELVSDGAYAMDRALPIARKSIAAPEDVAFVLAQPVAGGNGRSEWVFLRLFDGTLALATFPQGDTYMAISDPGKAPFYD